MENLVDKPAKPRDVKKFMFGFLIILAGLVLLLENFNLVPYVIKHIFFSWQMLLIAIGIISISGNEKSTAGYILIMIGAFFMIPEIFNMHVSFARVFWPVLLIAIGVFILFRRGFREEILRRRHRHIGFNDTTATNTDEGYLNEASIFAGSKHRVVNQVFRGGRISTLFGGSEIDLTHATLGEGRNELIIDCMFGGVTLIVPCDWRVVLNVSSVLGGFSDKRLSFCADPNSPNYLVIKGTAIFGGGEIKSV